MNWPATLLRLIFKAMPPVAYAGRFRFDQGVGDVIDSALSGVALSQEDFEEACYPRPSNEGGLHVCPRCGSRLVQPVRWEQTVTPDEWRLWRRCPECEWHSDGIHDLHELNAFDEALEAGGEVLETELKEFEGEGQVKLPTCSTPHSRRI